MHSDMSWRCRRGCCRLGATRRTACLMLNFLSGFFTNTQGRTNARQSREQWRCLGAGARRWDAYNGGAQSASTPRRPRQSAAVRRHAASAGVRRLTACAAWPMRQACRSGGHLCRHLAAHRHALQGTPAKAAATLPTAQQPASTDLTLDSRLQAGCLAIAKFDGTRRVHPAVTCRVGGRSAQPIDYCTANRLVHNVAVQEAFAEVRRHQTNLAALIFRVEELHQRTTSCWFFAQFANRAFGSPIRSLQRSCRRLALERTTIDGAAAVGNPGAARSCGHGRCTATETCMPSRRL